MPEVKLFLSELLTNNYKQGPNKEKSSSKQIIPPVRNKKKTFLRRNNCLFLFLINF